MGRRTFPGFQGRIKTGEEGEKKKTTLSKDGIANSNGKKGQYATRIKIRARGPRKRKRRGGGRPKKRKSTTEEGRTCPSEKKKKRGMGEISFFKRVLEKEWTGGKKEVCYYWKAEGRDLVTLALKVGCTKGVP